MHTCSQSAGASEPTNGAHTCYSNRIVLLRRKRRLGRLFNAALELGLRKEGVLVEGISSCKVGGGAVANPESHPTGPGKHGVFFPSRCRGRGRGEGNRSRESLHWGEREMRGEEK